MRGRAFPFVIAIAAVVLVTCIKLAFAPIGSGMPFILYFAVVLFSAWYGGRGPAILATLLSATAADVLFLGARGLPALGAVALAKTGVFILESAVLIGLAEAIQTQRARAVAVTTARALEREESLQREVGLRRRLAVLSDAAEALSIALSRDEIARVVVERGTAAMNADTCTLYALDASGESLELIGSHGVEARVLDAIRHLDVGVGNAVYDNFEAGRELWVETHEEYAEAYPSLSKINAEGARVQAFWSVPLVVEDRPVGLLGMGFRIPRQFPAEERAFVKTFARQCAQALLRSMRLDRETTARRAAEAAQASLLSRMSEQKRDEEVRLLLAEATSTLAASLDYKTTLARLCALVVPKMADWCAVEMANGASGTSEQLAVAHVDPAMVKHAWELRRLYPPKPDAVSGITQVLRTGRAEIYPEINDESPVLGMVDEEHLRIWRELDLRSALIVPLMARGEVLGAITMVHAESGRHYTSFDLEVAEELARRASIAVDNALLYTAEQHARAIADDANRLKDEFLATVSHELRTPLNAILGWARMLAMGALDESKHERAIHTIERNAVSMAQLIDDLLDVSRIINGKMRLDAQLVELTPIVELAIDSLRPAAAAKDITLHHAPDGTSAAILGDSNRLQQVAWNLLSNAIKFTPSGGRVEVVVRRIEACVELLVSDNGAGIDPAFVPFVFDRFRQADGRITRSHGGLGLGLAIARHLVELHGGTIHAQSPGLGGGSTFRVTLPASDCQLGDVADAASNHALVSSPRTHADIEGLHVLAVDDDEDARSLIRTVLERAGARVTMAASVEEAMRLFRREIPHVVLSDIGMPGADGVDLIGRIRALSAAEGGRVPAAAVTAYARASDRARVMDAGYMFHLAKPVEHEELLAVVANLARLRG